MGAKGQEWGFAVDHHGERKKADTFVMQVETTSLPILKARCCA